MSVDRGFTWMDDETVALIDIFSKEEIQLELLGSKRNITVYERIATELSNVGFRRTAYQCREKIKRLRKEYQVAKYCVQNNIPPKKPMKHFDLVDKVLNRKTEPSTCDISLLNSDQEDEFHFSFNHDQESDASNSCTGIESLPQQIILPGPSCSPLLDEMGSPPNLHTDSNDTLLMNGEHSFDCSDKDSALEECESPWVPNVVLVENDLENGTLEQPSTDPDTFESQFSEAERLPDFLQEHQKSPAFADSETATGKRKKTASARKLLQNVVDNVTENFLKYQENAESRFLERFTQIEQERMRKEESMQKLWMEFEERRRKEEQEHELRMMSLFGQFLCQMNDKDIART
ncbi:uncharacterized protein LOC129228476 [Uloborus diversus]|uniref:uncharacterized protein LOC129228476 n=1 Tax=Uloborus diversus TaxID=327109 RepID=UPI0024090785|nr:uncharacterized protein LOC129228476 [Uloborus diversus]